MKTVIVGLPYFTNRLKKELTQFDPSNSYRNLDTYYSKADQIKALWYIPRASCVFSINGTVVKSRVFDLAFKHNIPLIINWAGSDVLKSLDGYRKGNFQQHYIDRAIHFCEAKWVQEELKEMGIHAEIVYFAISDATYEPSTPTTNELTILSYIPDRRKDFYGRPTLLKIAREFPEVNFLMAGSDDTDIENCPTNLKALGWVKNMDEVFDQAHATLRFTEHDGLSNIVRESLGRGKQVLYKYEFKHCIHCPDEATISNEIRALKKRLEQGEDLTNYAGAEFIQTTFERNTILTNLVEKISHVVQKN